MVAAGTQSAKHFVFFFCFVFAFSSLAVSQVIADPVSSKATVEWRRADFLVTGAGCVLCIRRLTYVLRHSAGVREASVEIRKPHKATIIYDGRQTSLKKIFSQFASDSILKTVKVEQLEDRPLSKAQAGSKE